MTAHRIISAHSIAWAEPKPEAEAVTDFLFGECVVVKERANGFVRVRNDYDQYEGWIPDAVLGPDITPLGSPPFRVRTRVCPAFDKPAGDTVFDDIGIGSPLHPQARIEGWLQDASGLWFRETDIVAVPARIDRVDVALEFLGIPYVWGGRHGSGIDCSGLIQIGAMLTGLDCERDTKDQVGSFGEKLGGLDAPGLKRGDVLYVPGHVALLTGPDEAVHADGKAGLVHVQKLDEIVTNRGFTPADVTMRRPAV